MSEFYLYGSIGFEHIVAWDSFDHILFLLALSASVSHHQYKSLALLITAFTIGHSLTLIGSFYNFIHFSTSWIEVLIPFTIVVTAVLNLWNSGKTTPHSLYTYKYFLILIFGFIHGMGFANDLRMMLAKADSIFVPLLSMNVGLEIGQMLLIGFMLLLSYLARKYLALSDEARVRYVSVLALAGGLYFTILHLPFNN